MGRQIVFSGGSAYVDDTAYGIVTGGDGRRVWLTPIDTISRKFKTFVVLAP